MMEKTKPEITATIKFRGVTIEGMTVQELRELRDLLNDLVGPKVTERAIEHHGYFPWRYWDCAQPQITWGDTITTSSSDIVITCAS